MDDKVDVAVLYVLGYQGWSSMPRRSGGPRFRGSVQPEVNMSKLQLIPVLALALICLIASPTLAERSPTVVPLSNSTPVPVTAGHLTLAPGVPLGCQVGNLNPAAWAINDWAFPPEAYYLNFYPGDTCSDCTLGFNVTAVHWVLQTDGPCEIDLSVGLYGTDFSDPACPVPGAYDCVSPLFTVTLPSAGLWDIAIPLDCLCADPQYLYALGVDVLDYRCDTGRMPDIITDDLPTTCTSWNDYGAGWVDLVGDFGFPGNLIMFADAECCEPAVGLEESSWGRVKGLFKDD